jgi:hypothetical protein
LDSFAVYLFDRQARFEVFDAKGGFDESINYLFFEHLLWILTK